MSIANYLIGQNLHTKFDGILTSTRCVDIECANVIQKNLKNDCDYKQVEVKTCKELNPAYPIRANPPDAEDDCVDERTFFLDEAKCALAFSEYISKPSICSEKNNFYLIICHANVIRYMITKVLQQPLDGYKRFTVSPGSFSCFVCYGTGDVAVGVVGDTSF